MKKIALVLSILLFTSSAFAGSCPMMAKGVDLTINDIKLTLIDPAGCDDTRGYEINICNQIN